MSDDAIPDVIAALLATVAELKARVAEMERAAAEHRVLKPLKAVVPAYIDDEVARRAAESGELVAEKPRGRWLSTEAAVREWLAATGRTSSARRLL